MEWMEWVPSLETWKLQTTLWPAKFPVLKDGGFAFRFLSTEMKVSAIMKRLLQ